MPRACTLIIVAALLSLPAAGGQEKRSKNRKAEDAAKWLAAGDHFSLRLSGCGKEPLFTTDKKWVADGPKGAVFLISKEEAAAFVQVVVDCGLWERWETSLPGGPVLGRIVRLGNGDPRDAKLWILGDCTDDLRSMVIFQHLLKTFQGERQQAVKDWLANGLHPKGK